MTEVLRCGPRLWSDDKAMQRMYACISRTGHGTRPQLLLHLTAMESSKMDNPPRPVDLWTLLSTWAGLASIFAMHFYWLTWSMTPILAYTAGWAMTSAAPCTLGGIPKWFLSAPTWNALPALIWPYIELHACLQRAQGVLMPYC